MRLVEPNVLERLFEHGGEVYGHILQVFPKFLFTYYREGRQVNDWVGLD